MPLTKKAAPGTRPCERCGHPVPAEHAFCAECGAKVPAARTGTRVGPAGAEAAFALVAVRPDGTDGPRHPVTGPFTAGTGDGRAPPR